MHKNIILFSMFSIFAVQFNIQASQSAETRADLIARLNLPEHCRLNSEGTHVETAGHSHSYAFPCFDKNCGRQPGATKQTVAEYLSRRPNAVSSTFTQLVHQTKEN